MNLALYALTLAAFAIGTTEFVIMGLLPEVARDLGVDLVQAGWLITGYALGVAAGAPVLTLLGRRWPRKNFLIGLMVLFILGNAWAALAHDYTSLMGARLLAALTHGSFFGVGSVLAASLVDPSRKAQAVALMFAGLTLANILGVPMGTWVGQRWGWHSTFGLIAMLGAITLLTLWRWVPRDAQHSPPSPMGQELHGLRRWAVWTALGTTVLGFGGVFTLFTYIAAYLSTIAQLPAQSLSVQLLLFGLGATLGNVLGGHWADRALTPSLLTWISAMALLLLCMPGFTTNAWTAGLAMSLWGLLAFAMVPALQMQVLAATQESPSLAASLNIAAFNVGNALGAWVGGMALPMGLAAVAWTAAGVTALGGMLALASAVSAKSARTGQ